MDPYLRWVHAWARDLTMPYLAIGPVIIEGYVPQIIPYPDMPTNVEELRKSWIQLREERDTFESQFQANEKKVLELVAPQNLPYPLLFTD